MNESDIKFKTMQFLKEIKYMSIEQTNHFKAYVRHRLNLKNTDKINKLIQEVIEIYFSITVNYKKNNK